MDVHLKRAHVPRILRRRGRRRHAEPPTIELVRRPYVDCAQQRARVEEILEKHLSHVRCNSRLGVKPGPGVAVRDVSCQVDGADADGRQDKSDQGDEDGLIPVWLAKTLPLR